MSFYLAGLATEGLGFHVNGVGLYNMQLQNSQQVVLSMQLLTNGDVNQITCAELVLRPRDSGARRWHGSPLQINSCKEIEKGVGVQ